MQRIPDTPPLIPPVSGEAGRPFWSVMIPVYNCAQYLEDCLGSVLKQDPGPAYMQIEVVDDASTDADVEALVQEIGRGRVQYFRQQRNKGSLRNFETCLLRSRGHYVHLLHGDDRVKTGFYAQMQQLLETYPEAGAAFCAWETIDEHNEVVKQAAREADEPGILANWLYEVVQYTRIQYVSIVVKRAVYEELGAFYGVTYGEDWEMWARIAKHFPTAYTPLPMAQYRQHTSSISGHALATGQHMRDIQRVIKIISGYLPHHQQEASQKAFRNYFEWSSQQAKLAWEREHHVAFTSRQIRTLMQYAPDAMSRLRLLNFYMKVKGFSSGHKTAGEPAGGLVIHPGQSYNIIHVQVPSLLQEPALPVEPSARTYCVFWWKGIALGDLFLEKNQRPEGKELWREVWKSVAPALKYYARQDNRLNPDYGEFPEQLLRLMEETCKRFYSSARPAKAAISVVICTRNRSAHLETCLHSIMMMDVLPAQIIVVDNAPDNDSTLLVAQKFPLVKYVREPRAGLDIARNRGAFNSDQEIVAYLDDDVKVHPDWAFRTWAAFQNTSVHATTGLIISASLETESQQIFEKYWGFNKGYRDIVFDGSFLQKCPVPRVWDIGAGANMAFRKSSLLDAGLFDERLDVGAAGCNGDSEMWFRMLLAGFVIQYCPRIIVFHEHRKDMKALKKQLSSYMRGHTAAALIQHQLEPGFGYRNYLFRVMMKGYLRAAITGFPLYKDRYRTLWVEMRGVAEGFQFFRHHRTRTPLNY